jgi:hypothetical protein
VQFVELGSLGGDIYFKEVACCLMEVSTIYGGSYLTTKFGCERILKFAVGLEAVVFLLFLLSPTSIAEASGNTVAFFIVCLLASKFSNDLINLMIYLNLPKMFTDKYIGLFVVLSKGSSRFLLIAMPTINHIMKLLSLHPFVFYGVILFVCRILLVYTKEVQAEGLDELMNECGLSMVQRMAIASGSHSMAGSLLHDQILKKIKVKGIQLSVIRRQGTMSRANISQAKSHAIKLEVPLLGKGKDVASKSAYAQGVEMKKLPKDKSKV